MEVTTGLPQWSPISPVLFAIYIAGIHQAVESQIEDSRGISFVDDVTWILEGTDLNDVVDKLERCADASLRWTLLSAEEASTVRPGDPGGRPDGPLRTRGHTAARYLTRFYAHTGGRPMGGRRKGSPVWLICSWGQDSI